MNIFAFYLQWSVLREEEQDEENFMVDDKYYRVEKGSRQSFGISLPGQKKESMKLDAETDKLLIDSEHSARMSPLTNASKNNSSLLHHYAKGAVKPSSHNPLAK